MRRLHSLAKAASGVKTALGIRLPPAPLSYFGGVAQSGQSGCLESNKRMRKQPTSVRIRVPPLQNIGRADLTGAGAMLETSWLKYAMRVRLSPLPLIGGLTVNGFLSF